MRLIYLYFVFFLSGLAGLGYEILWTRMFSVSLGHEISSMLAVVCAFFGGICLGGWVFDRPVSRSRVPGLWYMAFEIIIGGWALLLTTLVPVINPLVASLIGAEPTFFHHWLTVFLCVFILLLPATAAMGGTLAAMDRLFTRLKDEFSVAGLYGINTMGAMAGTVLVSFRLIPSLGITAASYILIFCNILCAAGVWSTQQKQLVDQPISAGTAKDAIFSSTRIFITLIVTGFLGVTFEVVMVRALSQMLENTVFTFTLLLSVYLAGTAIGSMLYQCFGRRFEFTQGLTVLVVATSSFCLLSIIVLPHAEDIFISLHRSLGEGFRQAILSETLLGIIIFLLPTILMGATFSHLAQHLKKPSGGVGKALSLNTLGGTVAPPLAGIYLLPAFGLKPVLLALAGCYLLLIPRLRTRSAGAALVPVIMLGMLFFDQNPYRFITTDRDDVLVSYQEGITATVSVIQDSDKNVHLKVNNQFQMGGTSSVYSDLRQAQLPLLLHERPESALFLGLGTGVTFSGAADYPGLQAEAVELIPEVIKATKHFQKASGDLDQSKNLRIVSGDARHYVTATEKKYDVVIADLFHPARDGAGALYSLEHFRSIRNVLTEDGLFCQWLPLYQMNLATLKVIIRTFMEVFPEGQAYLAHYSITNPIIGLVGSTSALRYPEKWFREKMRDPAIRKKVLPLKYDSFYSLFGTFLAGNASLKEYSGGASINSDDHPVVIYQAPRFLYSEQEPPYTRLISLVNELGPASPEDILADYITEEDYLAKERLQAYWKARNSFLLAGTKIEKTRDVQKLYESAREPLLAVIRQSLDFSAAYYPLLSIAYEIYPYNRDASYQLLNDLIRVNPMKREAALLQQKIFAE
ncbi:fused MFS/spermidine synthase [Desulfogranum marinum]|uniref:fused MFS/spermidine synthase n=1 Tax=Desulfogranum marinum TaxID=453220 RepID=UPI001963337F|nr:fused MFS/spermidine synthase [Desulfogranum marinum]MBM9512415.1 fused MFS/spermidine synthase [Desulfogranum marinum]